jgi:hypothetical protein
MNMDMILSAASRIHGTTSKFIKLGYKLMPVDKDLSDEMISLIDELINNNMALADALKARPDGMPNEDEVHDHNYLGVQFKSSKKDLPLFEDYIQKELAGNYSNLIVELLHYKETFYYKRKSGEYILEVSDNEAFTGTEEEIKSIIDGQPGNE